MDVRIVEFPETRVALIEHRGPPSLEHETARKLIQWRIQEGLLDQTRHRSYGVHHTDPRSTPPEAHRVDFCLSIEDDVAPNALGITETVIPALRCACARHLGSRQNNTTANALYGSWLPQSGEAPGAFPLFFHYVNVGPDVREADMITDVYLPLL